MEVRATGWLCWNWIKVHGFMKRNIYIINEEGVAAMYGIGTFIENLRRCFDDSAYNIIVINLNSRIDEVSLYFNEIISTIDIPSTK